MVEKIEQTENFSLDRVTNQSWGRTTLNSKSGMGYLALDALFVAAEAVSE